MASFEGKTINRKKKRKEVATPTENSEERSIASAQRMKWTDRD